MRPQPTWPTVPAPVLAGDLQAAAKTQADQLVRRLELLGVTLVFGVPGGAIEPLVDALARSERRAGPRLVVARHESGAAFMADGYHRETGRLGVVCATTGPGTTNLITGVSSALAESTPLLVLTAQTSLPKFGRRALQDSSCLGIDTVALLRACTRLSTLVSHPEQLQPKLALAIAKAWGPERGPVHLSIPSDVLRSPAPAPLDDWHDIAEPRLPSSGEEAIEELARRWAMARRCVVFVERNIGSAGKSVQAFCEREGVPHVAGMTGKYCLDERSPLYRGVFGFGGHPSAALTLTDPRVDLLLAVGAPLSELTSGGFHDCLSDNPRAVFIDEVADPFGRSPRSLHVLGPIAATFSKLGQDETSSRRAPARAGSPQRRQPSPFTQGISSRLARGELARDVVDPRRVVQALAERLPPGAKIYVDAGNAWAWMTHGFVHHPGGPEVHLAIEYGSMGWAVGAAIGAASAAHEGPVVALVGDGAYLMSGQELTVAVQHALPVIFVVLNDAALGMVKHGQLLAGAERTAWQLGTVDYALQATSIGAHGLSVSTGRDWDAIDWSALTARREPVLLDVHIDPDLVPPMDQRVADLARSGSRRLT